METFMRHGVFKNSKISKPNFWYVAMVKEGLLVHMLFPGRRIEFLINIVMINNRISAILENKSNNQGNDEQKEFFVDESLFLFKKSDNDEISHIRNMPTAINTCLGDDSLVLTINWDDATLMGKVVLEFSIKPIKDESSNNYLSVGINCWDCKFNGEIYHLLYIEN